MIDRRHRLPALIATSASVLSCLAISGLVASSPANADEGHCPDLHILAVQGTSQSSTNAPTKADQGMLSAVIAPVLGAASTDKSLRVDRTYVPYRANFGNRGLINTTYRDSATEGLNRLSQIANRVVTQCPGTKLVPLGYSQGGHVVDAFAAAVAGGQGSVPPDSIAFVVTYGSPTRAANTPLFPGFPGQGAPQGLPGLDEFKPPKFADQMSVSNGQGIGPEVDQISDFGPLGGRVADFCIPGDLACSAPRSASLLRLGANVVEQSNLDFEHDPTGTASRLAAAVADTAVRGTATVINADLTGTSLADLQVNPEASISERLAEVSSPRSLSETLSDEGAAATTTPPGATPANGTPGSPAPAPAGADNPLRAIARLGTIALNTVSTFATAMLTPENIASMVSAGVSAISAASGNPVGAVGGAASGSQLASAAMSAGLEAIPPATIVSGVKAIFQTLLNEVEANADLPQLVFDARTWNQVAYHGGYTKSPVSTTGAPATQVTANWIIHAAKAYARLREQEQNPPQAPKPGTADPTAEYRTDEHGNTAPVGAIEVNTRPAGRTPDHILLARNARATTPGSDDPQERTKPETIPVAIDNTTLTEAQRLEVATHPKFVDPNQVQRLARYGTIALSNQQVTVL
ncbi:cutinase family protein [Gordonia rubripertincta]|uniref:cutinase family protein n=1 Tax=Gordonia rubripertincta TaxID=36822 RepID=UPI00163D5DDA|nr:cutinase family protein [Gordonia rubripertincta]